MRLSSDSVTGTYQGEAVEHKPEITLEHAREIFAQDKLSHHFGIDFIEVGPDYMVARMTVDERHLRPGNIMNGGVNLVLIETVGSASSYLRLDLSKQNALGIQVSANHLSIARPGDKLLARSKTIHLGKTTHIWEVNITNEKDKVISTGRITMLITDR